MNSAIRRKRRSGLLFRYVSRELLLPFTLCIMGLLGLFVIADALDAQQDLANAGADWHYAVTYLLLRQPLNLIHVLPMSVLLATSFTASTMGRRHEVTAVRSSGISLLQWGRPFWILGLLMAVLTLYLSEFVVPRFSVLVRELRDGPGAFAAGEGRKAGRQLLAFRNRDANRDWFFEEFRRGGEGDGVLVKQYGPGGALVWELQAESARFIGEQWHFEDATLTRYRIKDGFPQAVENEAFDTYTDPAFDQPPATVTGTLRPTDDMAVRDMLTLLEQGAALPDRTRHILQTSAWYRGAYPWTCLMCALIGVGLNSRTERKGALAGFAASVGIIFLFYAVSEFFVLLGRTGRIPPVVGGVLPVLAFLGWATVRVYKNR